VLKLQSGAAPSLTACMPPFFCTRTFASTVHTGKGASRYLSNLLCLNVMYLFFIHFPSSSGLLMGLAFSIFTGTFLFVFVKRRANR